MLRVTPWSHDLPPVDVEPHERRAAPPDGEIDQTTDEPPAERPTGLRQKFGSGAGEDRGSHDSELTDRGVGGGRGERGEEQQALALRQPHRAEAALRRPQTIQGTV